MEVKEVPLRSFFFVLMQPPSSLVKRCLSMVDILLSKNACCLHVQGRKQEKTYSPGSGKKLRHSFFSTCFCDES
jgi:hypothetical protein